MLVSGPGLGVSILRGNVADRIRIVRIRHPRELVDHDVAMKGPL